MMNASMENTIVMKTLNVSTHLGAMNAAVQLVSLGMEAYASVIKHIAFTFNHSVRL